MSVAAVMSSKDAVTIALMLARIEVHVRNSMNYAEGLRPKGSDAPVVMEISVQHIFDQIKKERDKISPHMPDECHSSHDTRSSDSSLYDSVCKNCGATDFSGGGWAALRFPCLPMVKALM